MYGLSEIKIYIFFEKKKKKKKKKKKNRKDDKNQNFERLKMLNFIARL